MNHVYHSSSPWKNRIEDFTENPWIQNLFVDHVILWIFIAGVVVLITAIEHELRIVHRELSELRQLLEKKTEQSPPLP